MDQQSTDSATEIKRLQRCMSDLVSVLALPAVWNVSESSRILETFLDALLGILDLDFLYARARFGSHESPIEALRTAPLYGTSNIREELGQALNRWSGEDPQQWPDYALDHLGGKKVSLYPIRLGIDGGLGLIVAGSQRLGFPEQTESLVLGVAANQLAIGLQQTMRLNEQKQIASELDRRVTERTRELAEANKELQLQVGLLQHLPVSAWTLKPDGTPDFVNRVWLEFSGQTLDFVRSHPEAWMSAVHPEDREAASKAFREGVSSGKGFAIETRSLRTRDGVYRWHLQQAVAVRDSEGKVLRFVGTTTDIDDQKRAQEALRASEISLRQTLDTIPGLVSKANSNGMIELANRQLLRYFGKTTEEMNSWSTSDVVHRDDLPRVTAEITHSFKTGTPFDSELRYRRADGVHRWFQARSLPFRGADDEVAGWYFLLTDIEDRKRAEDALRASETNLRQILDGIPGLVCTLNPAGQIDLANRRLLDFFGMTVEELNSWGTNGAVHPDDLARVIAELTGAMTAGTDFDSELRYRRADGLYRWSQTRILPVRDAEGGITRWFGLITDIDDRKRAEEKLRESEYEARLIVDSIPGMVAATSPSGNLEMVSQQALKFFGRTVEELDGWGTNDTIHPEDLPGVIDVVSRALSTGSPYEVLARFRRADGVYRWFQDRSRPVRDKNGDIARWYILITDVDDQKRAEEALRESEFESRLIVDSIPGLIAVLDANGEIERVNQPLLDYLGKSMEEMRQWAVDDTIHPNDRPGYVQAFERAFATGDPVEYEAVRIRRFDGVYRWLNMRGLPLRDRQGHIVRWYFLLTEVEDRKRAEDELRRSEARHRVVVETASDAVVSIDESGVIILANLATKRIFGYAPEELIGKPLTILMPGAMGKLHAEGFKRYLETGAKHLNWRGTEMIAQRANGEEFPTEVSFGEMVVDQRKVFTGFIRDISEKKRAEQALRDTQAELARMMRVMTIGQLTASIAHEVNQPLSGIVTNASTCLRMLRSDPPNIDGARETAQRAIRDGNRASEVIQRLRTLFSKKQTEVERLDLNEAAREVIALLSGELQRNNVILKQEFSDHPPTVHGDRVQLQQVILNLLRNACEAMICIEDRPRQIVLKTELEGEHVRLSVQDSGVGLTSEVADQMFESFFTTKSDGMGVGLSVSRSIIEANHGRLWATPNDGPGATFAFSIPCDYRPQAQDGG